MIILKVVESTYTKAHVANSSPSSQLPTAVLNSAMYTLELESESRDSRANRATPRTFTVSNVVNLTRMFGDLDPESLDPFVHTPQ